MKKAAYYIVLALLIIVCGTTAYGAYYYFDKYQKIDGEYFELIDLKTKLQNEFKALSDLPDEAKEADESDESVEVDTSGWATYTNAKYGFSFKHPSTYTTAGCPTKPCGEYIGEMSGGDQTVMQGDISEVGWPNIAVMHLSSDFYNPPVDTDLREWILASFSYYGDYISLSPNYIVTTSAGGSLSSYDFTYPASPQSYSQRYIYFLNDDNELFVIQMYDYESYSEEFYDAWLGTFIY